MRSRLALYQTLRSASPSLHCVRARIRHSYDLLQLSCCFLHLSAPYLISYHFGEGLGLFYIYFVFIVCLVFVFNALVYICSSELFPLSSFSYTCRFCTPPPPPASRVCSRPRAVADDFRKRTYSCILYRVDNKPSESSADALSGRTHRAYYYTTYWDEATALLYIADCRACSLNNSTVFLVPLPVTHLNMVIFVVQMMLLSLTKPSLRTISTSDLRFWKVLKDMFEAQFRRVYSTLTFLLVHWPMSLHHALCQPRSTAAHGSAPSSFAVATSTSFNHLPLWTVKAKMVSSSSVSSSLMVSSLGSHGARLPESGEELDDAGSVVTPLELWDLNLLIFPSRGDRLVTSRNALPWQRWSWRLLSYISTAGLRSTKDSSAGCMEESCGFRRRTGEQRNGRKMGRHNSQTPLISSIIGVQGSIINDTLARSLEPVVTECKEHTIHTQTQIVASRKPKEIKHTHEGEANFTT